MPSKQTIWRISFALMITTLLTPMYGVTAQTSNGTYPQCVTPPDTINVWIVVFKNEWPVGTNFQMGVVFEDYVYGVVMGELGPVVPQGPYSGQAWSDQVLQAQSVAARTWGSYYCAKWYSNGGYGVKNGDTDQVYRPNRTDFGAATKQHYIDVSYAMRDIHVSYDGLLVQSPYDGKLLDAQYRRDVGNPSMSWTGSGYDYLRSVNNPYTIGYADGLGWAQTPSQRWVRENDQRASWYQTLVHYYTGVSMMNRQSGFNAQYWNNTTCTGTSVGGAHLLGEINFDWGAGSPDPRVSTDNFCVEFSNANVNFPYCTLANFRHMHVNILLGPPGIKAQSTSGRQNGTYQPLNGVLGRMKTSTQLVV